MTGAAKPKETKPKLPDKLEDFIRQCEFVIKQNKALKIRYDKFLLMAMEPHRQEPKVDAALTRLGVPNKMSVLDNTVREKGWEVYIDAAKAYLMVAKRSDSYTDMTMDRITEMWIDPEGKP